MIPKRIVVIGGSTVHGEGDPEGGGFVARLKRWHESSNLGGHYVFNLGISGNAVADMLERGPSEAMVRVPNLIILYPGLNDSRRKSLHDGSNFTSFEDFRTQLKDLSNKLAKIAPTILMSSVPLDEKRTSPFRGKYHFLFSDAVAVTGIASSIAKENNLFYLDLFERWTCLSNFQELLADGLHCNGLGHDRLFEEVKSFICEKFNGEGAR
jgi:lysophospholipase L1-like esterase